MTDFFNREITHLKFHARVLEQSKLDRHPLLERLKFLLIFSNNLDEFFEIRVAGLKRKIAMKKLAPGIDGQTPQDVLAQISDICHKLVEHQYEILNDTIFPQLRQEGVYFLRRSEWSQAQHDWARKYMLYQVLPVLSPISLDQSHPFPRLANKSLNFIVSLEGVDLFGRESRLAIVPAPRSLPRVIQMPEQLPSLYDDAKSTHVFLSSIIHAFIDEVFPGMNISGCYQFRVTRNADLRLDEDEIDDLALALQDELISREYGDEVRLEVADNCPQNLSDFLLKQFDLHPTELYQVNGMVNLARMFPITALNIPALRHTNFSPKTPVFIARQASIFKLLKTQDILLHHPYEDFACVVDFLRQAARDPEVLAIKQTLYRCGKKSEILNLLEEAALNGIEVTVIIEVRARFEEAENIGHANRLQKAGATVCYGVVGFKTHAKLLLVLRRENNKVKRYTHLGTGNYHPDNARLYTDFSLLTAKDSIGVDANQVFQALTGLGKELNLQELIIAPFNLLRYLLNLVDHEIEVARSGHDARIILKVNAITDPQLIQKLYQASQAGVRVDLIVRGICCIKPQQPGLSENIYVRSIVGRFLEHTRVYYFANGNTYNEAQTSAGSQLTTLNNSTQEAQTSRIFISSADLMDRSFFRRVEICVPILDKDLAQRLYSEGLAVFLEDTVDAWTLDADGHYSPALDVPVNTINQSADISNQSAQTQSDKPQPMQLKSVQQELLDKHSTQ